MIHRSRYYHGVAFRVDEEKSKSTTSRTLRSGRAVDMIKYKGIIYKEVFERLQNVEFKVNVLPCGGYCDYHALRLGLLLRENLLSLYQICSDRQVSTYAQGTLGKKWEIIITGMGDKGNGRRFLELILDPLINEKIYNTIKCGDMSMTVRGSWGKNWQNIFRKFRKLSGFSAENVVEVEVGRIIPRILMDMVEEEGVEAFMEFPPWFY